jgi:hypothetical protein
MGLLSNARTLQWFTYHGTDWQTPVAHLEPVRREGLPPITNITSLAEKHPYLLCSSRAI